MRWDDIHIAGLGTHLPPPVGAREAMEAGRYPADEFEENQLISALESDDLSAVDMAVAAGRQAMERSGRAAEDIALVLHASMYHQGEDFWTPASYVQRHTVGGTAPAIHVDHASNGGMAALELAASWLNGRTDASAALVSTGDRYALPGFDRWYSDSGQVFADGATALVLSRGSGFARLLATHSTSDPELEDAYRDVDGGFTPVPHATGKPLDLRGRKRRYMKRVGHDFVVERLVTGLLANTEHTLAEADTSMDGIARVVVPNVGRELLEWEFLTPYKIDVERTVWDWGRRTCHIGGGDQFAGLTHLLESGQLQPGDQVLVVGVGIGFSWTTAVVQVDEVPDWTGPDAGTLRVLGRA
ncbi:ketoacyl-ACP synthase III family protein [Streptomyces sp. NPDC047079]|uniref:ketoacyl-ACP synthase III family protein n=1 Tax=Streptomyces sp. NPDC047079 TaxID=3154607 RepID=UPI0033CE37A2